VSRTGCSSFRAYLLVLSVCCSAAVQAESDPAALNQLKQLAEQGQSAKAYKLASALEPEFAGTPTFDFYYGMVAVDSGHADEGVMALERVLLTHPENNRVRLEYARALYLTGANETAVQEFQRVLEEQPPEAVEFRIRRYLAKIENRQRSYQPSWLFSAQLAAGYDSNLNSAPDDQLDQVQLTAGSLGQGDSFSDIRLAATLNHPLDKQNSLIFRSGLHQKLYEDHSDFNNRTLNLSGAWQYRFSKVYRLKTSLRYQNYNSGRSTYRHRYALSGDFNHNFSNTLGAGFNLTYSQLNYPDADLAWRDADHYNIGLSVYKTLPLWHSPLLFFSAFYGEETPDVKTAVSQASAERMLSGGSLGLQWTLWNQHEITLSGFIQNAEYGGNDWLYGVVREDDYRAISLNWKYRVTDAFSVSTGISLIENTSTIELYQYDRELFTLNLKYEY